MIEYIVEKKQTSGGWTWAEPKGKLIRCKDCKHWWQENNLCTHNKTMDGMVCSLQCDAYFYCGYAERKEE